MRGRSADEDALLRGIWDAPHDDAPRLVYADWLDEHGDSDRAAFIRIQCELARIDEAEDRFLDLQRTEARLWKKNRTKWTKGLPTDAQVYRRGFPVQGPHFLTLSQLVGFRLEDWKFVPILQLGLRGNLAKLDMAADWPVLARVGTLHLRGYDLTGVGFARFLASPHLSRLTGLDLNITDLGEAAVRSLVRSPVWPRLTRLALVHHVLVGQPRQASRALAILADARPVPPLAELTFRDAGLGVDDAKVLAGAPLLAGVRELNLNLTSISTTGVMALAKSPLTAALRGLDLGYVGNVSERGVTALAGSPHLVRLCRLSIGILSTPDSAEEFLTSPHMQRLRGLQVVYSARGKLSPGVRRLVRKRFGRFSLLRSAY